MPKQYRFRGSIEPTAAVKRPVRAEVVTSTEGAVGKMHLDDVIDSWGGFWGVSAKEVNAALAELGDVDEIHLHINSPGGEVYEGVAILNALRRHPATVTAIVDGLAASAASFIAVGADRTIMGRNTELMIHDAWGIEIGPAADMHAMGDRLDKLSDNIASMYAEKAGGDLAAWRALMLAETWYSAEEAVAAGLADEIEGTDTADNEIVAAAFDLSVFKRTGRAAAPAPAPAAPTRTDPAADASDYARRHAQHRHQLAAGRHRLPA
ncbi:head maturation protease, ClpP-related [Catenuloplanes atrovinosus]|uniref:ATP-dependent Clp protease proteolytic subunit n=1 Tax=Catenuloplanes atrovinosus TaxID=137266 RepID=A0AAE3YV40_9ACTN|nr:head maturation protease, ClpP-related [Catenuloplanes atrovinosus]MDR7278928.1 ATP-dependent Clp endopeptidase proteolytic subunit ClpP [Catenuloplanes atrovinosus]